MTWILFPTLSFLALWVIWRIDLAVDASIERGKRLTTYRDDRGRKHDADIIVPASRAPTR